MGSRTKSLRFVRTVALATVMTNSADRTVRIEVFVVAKSINSLVQIEASVGSVIVALSGPLVESDAVFSCKADG